MRVSIVSLFLAGGLLAAGGALAQSASEVQGTAGIHTRQTAALDRALNRTLPRPRASSAIRSCEDFGVRVGAASQTAPQPAGDRCRSVAPLRRESQRQYRNAAIDRTLSTGQ